METQKIRRLPPHIAERIAAGEMIERPSSVVKELVENSLDAGCTEVRIVLEEGGKNLIEVTDNGSGMSPEDLQICVERHATSKLRSLEDLECISTLGFRGEAIPSIAAVTDLTLISRTQNAPFAYELRMGDIANRLVDQPQPQKITHGQFIDSQHGTQIRALGLFSQVPARLKFLKSQGAEVTQVREWIERLALAYPHVGFQLISDDRTILNLRPQTEESRVKAILSSEDDYPVLSAAHGQDGFRDIGFKARLYWIQGSSGPNSKNLIQIVNSRAVKDRMLQQAILAPFRQMLLPGQFPSVALLIEINPAAIDVNVHPTKSEVRFLDNRKVFQTIESLVKTIIAEKGAPAIALSSLRETSDRPPSEVTWPSPLASPPPSAPRLSFSSPNFSGQSHLWRVNEDLSIPQPSPTLRSPNPLDSARYVGSLFNTYLAYEQNSELILIDQHAAHERIRYEKLKKRIPGQSHSHAEPPAQALLIPEVIKFPIECTQLLSSRLEWITHLGFDVEIFGDDTLLFRQVPAEWGTRQLKVRLKNLVDRVLSFESPAGSVFFDETVFESLASEACHSAVRAGDHLELEEIRDLARQLFECEHPWNCPHGRPTVVKISQGKLEEWFQRKV